MRNVSAVFRLLLAVCLFNALATSPSLAQNAEGFLGWQRGGSVNYFPTARDACYDWYTHIADWPATRFIGSTPWPDNPNFENCSWTRASYLCPEEGGGALTCGNVQPSYVQLRCATGYTRILGAFCVKDQLPERPCDCTNGSSENPTAGNPIVLLTGTKAATARDFATADDEFVISRSYRSIPFGKAAAIAALPRGLGGNWNFDFGYELRLDNFSGTPATPDAKVTVLAPDGSAYDFVLQSSGTWAVDTSISGAFFAEPNLKLEYVGTLPSDLSTIRSASSQWRLTDRDDTVWTFATFAPPNAATPFHIGRPTLRADRSGYQWTFAYRPDSSLETITDSFGRQATFNWAMFYVSSLASPPAGALPFPEAVKSIDLPDGTSLRFTYDPPASTAPPSTSAIVRLVKVERLNASATIIDSTTYSYSDPRHPRLLTGITDHNGVEVADYAYDARGRAISTAGADGTNAFTVEYAENTSERTSRVINPLGKAAVYHFTSFGHAGLTSVAREASTNSAASTRSLTYSGNFIATRVDEEGRTTSYARDSRGRPTTVIEAYGTPQARTTTINWNSSFNVPDRIVRPGLQVDYTYYPNGQLQTHTETDTTAQSVPYSTNGQARTWTYTWGTGGRLASVNGPRPIDGAGKDDTLTFAYDTAGNLQTSTNGLGQVTTFASYDASGRPGTMTDPNGMVTAFTYDTLGRATTITMKHPSNSALDAVTSFDYDIHDRVTGITSPVTDKLFIDYDAAGRVTTIRAASGERIDYQTDKQGNVTGKTVKRADASIAEAVSSKFDELGRLLSQSLGSGRTTVWAYDKVDNIKQVTSARNTVTQAAFDPLNRLVSTIAPDTGTTATAYNALDEVTSHTDPISVQTTFVRDGFGDVIQEVSPDRGTSTYYYNEAGELTASIDGRGQRVDYTRDILGRIVSKTPFGHSSETVTYTWDIAGISGSYGVGRLASVTDATGTTSFAYDHRGNLIAKRQSIGSGSADLAYAYDLADRITQITYPSGRIVAYTRDTKGGVAQVSTKASANDPTWTSLASSITYEPWGSIAGAQFGNGLALQEIWTDGRLTTKRLYAASTNTNLSWLTYNYDANDNIGAIRDRLDESNSAYYGYDVNDRLSLSSRVLAAAPAAETYSYTAGTNRLASLTDSSGTRSITYDNRGNTIGEARPGGATVSTSYDGYGRLLTYNRTGEPAQANAYNGLDDRVSVTSGSNAHTFVYDPDGRMIGEYGTSASDVIAETIWLSPEVANDNQPLGGDDGVGGYAPLAVATGSGTGTALYWTHGNHMGVPIISTDTTGAAAIPPAYTMRGFPGQMRSLADLYYNRHRDYDSSTGRYIQADPIGLGGGENPYVYANNNPLRWTDPSGLAPRKLDPNSDECKELARKIENIRRDIAKRMREVQENPGSLPEYMPGGKPRESVQGHRTLILKLKKRLRDLEQLYAEKCGGGDCPPDGSTVKNVAIAAGTAGALYITYRIIRMIPSLAPPLWPSIPVNAAIP